MELNESPVFLLLDPTTRGGTSAARDELPVSLFESELHVVEGNPSFTFVQTSYTIATEEAERIGVDQVSKLLPSGNAAGTDQCKHDFFFYLPCKTLIYIYIYIYIF